MKIPGPGEYTNCTTFYHKPFFGINKIGKSFRKPLNETDPQVPGPGTYNL